MDDREKKVKSSSVPPGRGDELLARHRGRRRYIGQVVHLRPRNRFRIPVVSDDEEIYFIGNRRERKKTRGYIYIYIGSSTSERSDGGEWNNSRSNL